MAVFHDQLNREVSLPSVPRRIISVVPSQTELLFYLGLNEEVTRITKFCVHPADKFLSVTKIGGTKQLDIDKIRSLKPDLVIANKEENERTQIEELMNICPAWISDISNLGEALTMIKSVGELVGKVDSANALCNGILTKFEKMRPSAVLRRTAYFIWRKPYMAAGKATFIDDMLNRCGLINAIGLNRYPEISAEMLKEANPEIILLSSEPYPFKAGHMAELQAIVPSAVIKLVDGEAFSWYGSRLLHTPGYFNELIRDIETR